MLLAGKPLHFFSLLSISLDEKGQVYNGYCSYGWFANQTA